MGNLHEPGCAASTKIDSVERSPKPDQVNLLVSRRATHRFSTTITSGDLHEEIIGRGSESDNCG